jgi:hypothetical protein
LKNFFFFGRALLAAVTDEIKANKLADTNLINDLIGFSSESQVSKTKFKVQNGISVYFILDIM